MSINPLNWGLHLTPLRGAAVRLSGLAMLNAYEAVQELETKRIITVERFGADELNIRFVTRAR